jgi:hypothetical protein
MSESREPSRPVPKFSLWSFPAAAAFVTLVVTLLALGGTAAAELGDDFVPTDGVELYDTDTTTNVRSPVWDIVFIDNTAYVAGKFLNVVDHQSGRRHAQPYLAAFDGTTGEWLEWWLPELDGPAYALDVTPSGDLLVGGEFSQVNNTPNTSGLVALDPATGELATTGWSTSVTSQSASTNVVRDIVRRGNDTYITGSFSQILGGVANPRQGWHVGMARLGVDGRPDHTWTPSLQGGEGWGIEVSTDGTKVHVGGIFGSVNNTPDTEVFATVEASTGELAAGWVTGLPVDGHRAWEYGGSIHDLGVWGDNLYVSGAEHYIAVVDLTTGQWKSVEHSPHDTQNVEVIGDRVYIGCHCRIGLQWMYEIDAATGTRLRNFTTNFRAGAGGWAAAKAPDECLWMGGDFKSGSTADSPVAGSVTVHSFARVCDEAGPTAHNVPSLVSPWLAVAPTSCLATSVNGEVSLTWVRAADDNAESFVIRRSRNGSAFSWAARVNEPATSWTDTSVSQATYAYQVETVSFDGSRAVTTCGPDGGVVVVPPVTAVAPVSCVASQVGGDVVVSWVRAAGDEASRFIVRRSRDGGAFGWAASVNAPATSWTNVAVAPATYAYRVETVAADNSRATTTCGPNGGVVFGFPATAPTSCSATLQGNDVDIDWVRAANDNAEFFIVRRSRNGGPLSWAGRVNAPGASFTNTGLQSGSYSYAVEAVSADGSRDSRPCAPAVNVP